MDGGTEFLTERMKEVCEREKIEYEIAEPECAPHNGVAERFNRTLKTKVISLLTCAKMPVTMWKYAARHAAYLYNRTPHSKLGFIAPYEKFCGKQPNLEFVQRFGSVGYMRIPRMTSPKFAAKSFRVIVIGNTETGVKCLHVNTNNVLLSKDVKIIENRVFGDIYTLNREYEQDLPEEINWKRLDERLEQNATKVGSLKEIFEEKDNSAGKNALVESVDTNDEHADDVTGEVTTDQQEIVHNAEDTVGQIGGARTEANSETLNERHEELAESEIENTTDDVTNNETLTERNDDDLGTKINDNSDSDDDFNEIECEELDMSDAESDSNIPETKREKVISNAEILYCLQTFVQDEPLTYADAMRHKYAKEWRNAVKNELSSIEKNKTWEIVDKTTEGKIIDSKWVFKIKSDGKNQNFKARLVVRGFLDSNVYDLTETYAPVARLSLVRCLLSIANKFKMSLHQLDVKTAFLNGDLPDNPKIFMKIPDGYRCSTATKENKVCLLRKALYGLRVSPKRWYIRFADAMKQMKFIKYEYSPCLFVWRKDEKVVLLLLYVDDILITGNCDDRIFDVKRRLREQFEITDMGSPTQYLGLEIEIKRDINEIRIHQKLFIDKMLEKFGFSDAHPKFTPRETIQVQKRTEQHAVSLLTPKELRTEKNYRKRVGSLLYLCNGSRPDIAHAVNVVSRKQNNPNDLDWYGIERIFMYLIHTKELTMIYRSEYDTIDAYSDASLGSESDGTSMTGTIVRTYGDIICWRSKKQSNIAKSSAEAEYVALSEATSDVMFFSTLIRSITKHEMGPIVIYEDNRAAIELAKKEYSECLRHLVKRHFHFVCDHVQRGEIILEWIPSEEQLADVLTKSLSRLPLERLRKFLLSEGNVVGFKFT